MNRQMMLSDRDFRSIRMSVLLKNLVSGTCVDAGGVVIGDKYQPVTDNFSPPEITELDAGSVILAVPSEVCALGHRLELELSVEQSGAQAVTATVPGVVTGLEKISMTQIRVSVRLKDPGDAAWQSVLRALSGRQEEIDSFLQSARGY